jgi:hypothetical protein
LFVTLKEAAIEQDLELAGVDQMFRTGHRAGRAKELDVGHAEPAVSGGKRKLARAHPSRAKELREGWSLQPIPYHMVSFILSSQTL